MVHGKGYQKKNRMSQYHVPSLFFLHSLLCAHTCGKGASSIASHRERAVWPHSETIPAREEGNFQKRDLTLPERHLLLRTSPDETITHPLCWSGQLWQFSSRTMFTFSCAAAIQATPCSLLALRAAAFQSSR
jgi:hypothetical protein